MLENATVTAEWRKFLLFFFFELPVALWVLAKLSVYSLVINKTRSVMCENLKVAAFADVICNVGLDSG